MDIPTLQSSPRKHIVAMGGGGWGMEPNNPLLDFYVYNLLDKSEPKVCFLPTASGDSEKYVSRFYEHFAPQPACLSHLSLFEPPTSDLENLIFEQDIIYVGGGNTKNLIALWKEWQLDRILQKAWEKGIILCGVSAGSICWFQQGVTDSIPGQKTALDCLGFLAGSNCPHYNWDVYREGYHQLLLQGAIANGYATDDGVALHFTGDELSNIVSSRPNAMAYFMENSHGKIKETPLKPKYLG